MLQHKKAFVSGIMLLAFVLTGLTALGGDEDFVEMRIQCNSPDHFLIHCDFNGFDQGRVVIEGKEYSHLSLGHAGCPIMDQAGNPKLPALRKSFLIPDSARMEVRVLKSEFYEIEGLRIAPWKGPIVRSVNPDTVPYPFSKIYEEDAWYPENVASSREPYILHDVRGLVVELFPFQYNPVREVLRVYEQIEVEIVNGGAGGVNPIDRSTYGYRPDRSYETLYERHFCNHGGNRTEPPPENGGMLVICHDAFTAAMQPFVDWKNATGIPTEMVSTATVGKDPASLRSFIQAYYQNNNLAYLLLVGDFYEVESPWFWGGVNGASDPAYSTITPDWYPDIFVGRFSAETVAHVQTQVRRTIEYEQEDHDVSLGAWHGMGMGIASGDGPYGIEHYHESDAGHMTKIGDELLSYGFTKMDPFYPDANYYEVDKGLTEGRRILNYCGHGGPQGWGTSGFSNAHVDALTNVSKLPFVNGVACNGGEFKDYTCFGEAWTRATYNGMPTGAIAAYMGSTGMYGPQPMYAQGNHAYNNQYGSADRFWLELNWSLGGCWFGGSCLMMDLCGTAGQDMFMIWNIFGDPSLRLTGYAMDKVLSTESAVVPLDLPVDIDFTLSAGAAHAGSQYFILGSASGTWPGLPLTSQLTLPINFDGLTELVIANANGPVFQNFHGVLDGSGEATATFSTAGATPINSHLVGIKLSFAAVVWPANGPFKLVTNPRMLYLVK
jgi:hypothetical protein